MARIKVQLPERFVFTTEMDIRISDINYGGHAGNDAILSLLHEARLRFLQQIGASETNFFGAGLIMSDAAIEYKAELFHGDRIMIHVGFSDVSKLGFDLVYKIERNILPQPVTAVLAKTGMICFNYETKRISALHTDAVSALENTLQV